ncbi:SDR family NAD(P)-dependent oxidoreductase [Glacieibacterium sp.]|uniref:SDR family NAD(P)-dependent oxidoreductase n=1 Tax=Glacieibacterium sp. TaxID=2860237 RepID=UPI003B00F446
MAYPKASLDGLTIAVTGAGSGIGRALAQLLASKGVRLALSDKDAATLAETSTLLGNYPHSTTVLDVSDEAGVKAWVDAAAVEFGGLDGIVNNAGLTVLGSFADTSASDVDRVLSVNFGGVVSGCRAALPHLRGRPAAWLVNISSVFGMMGYPGQSAYNASKFAVRGLTEALYLELAQTDPDIRVVRVHPGGIKTNVVRNAKVAGDMPVPGSFDHADAFEKASRTTAAEAARVIVAGMEAGDHRILIGADARLIDWLTRIFPVTYFKRIGSFLSKQAQAT